MIARYQKSKSRGPKLKNLFFIFFSLLSLVFSLLSLDSAIAQEEEKEPIIVNGDRVEYLYEEKKVIGVNNVVITYKDVVLTCDKIVVHMETKDAIAEGRVVLTQKGNIFKGEKVHYNFEKEKGTIIKAEARGEPWYGKGDAASKVEKEEYVIERGYITTCDLPHPHYRMQSRRVKIFIDDRVEAYHVLFFIGNVPVFYFPYYIHPLQDKRPRVTIVPGRNVPWGYFLLTAWRYYLHEWSRGYIHLDWREKKGFGEGIDYKYRLGYFGKGLARFYYTREKEVEDAELINEPGRKAIGDDRWRFQLRHKWQIDEDTTAVGEFHRLSDRLFIKDYYFDEEFETELQPETYLSIIKTRPAYNLSLYFTTRTNDFFTVVEKLPELRLELKNQRLRETNFYYKSTTTFTMLQKKFDDIAETERKLKANRFDTDHEISYLTNLFKFLTFNPFIGIRETWYSEDEFENKDELRNIYIFGTRFLTKFYKLFPVKTDVLGLDINALRHIVTPSVTYSYNPIPNIKSADLKQFDSVDSIGYNHAIDLELINRLQTKRGIEKEIVNLARFTTSSAISLHPKINEGDERTLDDFIGDIKFDLELTPYSWLTVNADSTFSTKRDKQNGIEAINFDMVAEKEKLWRFGLGYRFEQGYDDNGQFSGSSSQIITDMSYKLSPKWRIKAYHRFKKDADMTGFDVEEQNYVLERDLHCWFAELHYQVKRSEGLEVDIDHRIWLVMRLKVFPEMPLKMFSATYSLPRAGVETRRSY